MKNNFLGQDSVFNLYINKESWEDIRTYKDDYKHVIKQKELHRIPFVHRSPQFYCREYIVNYLKRVTVNKQLTHCSLHLAVYLLDIFMDNHSIVTERILLVANVCIFLAAKLEENNMTIPRISDLNMSLNVPYSIQDYKSLEILVLQFFHYYIMFPTAAHYTHYFLQAALCREDFDHLDYTTTARSIIKEMHLIIRNYLDKIIDDVHYMQCYKPSQLACAVISIARTGLGLNSWTDQLKALTNYAETDIEDTKLALLGHLPLYCKACVNKAF